VSAPRKTSDGSAHWPKSVKNITSLTPGAGVFSAVLGVVVVLSGSEVERQASQENGRQEVVDKIFFHLSVFLFITYINPKFHFLTV